MDVRSGADGLVRLAVSVADRARKSLDQTTLARAVRALDEDGAVILEEAIDPSVLREIETEMRTDLDVLLSRPDRAENFAPGHLQQDPPARGPSSSANVLANPFVLAVCRACLRQPLRLTAYSNNTNLPGSVEQAVHVDEGQLWPGLAVAHPPARLMANIPLDATDEARGAIELWLGSHSDTRLCQFSATADEGRGRALQYLRAARRANVHREVNRRVGLTTPEALVAGRLEERPPVRATTDAGSIILRDPRVWHRGMPNAKTLPRFMLSLTYDPTWRWCETPIVLPADSRELFTSHDLEVCATYVEGPIDHLSRHHPPGDSPLKRNRREPTE